MLALGLGTALAIGALIYVLFPLFAGAMPTPRRSWATLESERHPGGDDAVVALREIEFDRATGKLSDADYDELRSRYTAQALVEMRAVPEVELSSPDDEVERAVREFRRQMKSCVTCGPRPEPDAAWCSGCGRYLPGACASCGGAVMECGAHFCTACGRQLAA